MNIFVAIQHTYDGIELALFRGQTMLAQECMSKFNASSVLIPTLEKTLKAHELRLSDLKFIAANCGPGPFTTLRVVITSINGIAFASKIPLVGINGLSALMAEYADQSCDRTICILNAFNHDVYYAYYNDTNTLVTGAANGEQFLREIAQPFASMQKMVFLGNAVDTHRTLIEELFKERSVIPVTIPATCSVKQIGLMGYAQWQRNENVTNQLVPSYLKMQQFAKI
jgi:tRNA threonylcarbamoyladenosine biosynthesis protein TsaB